MTSHSKRLLAAITGCLVLVLVLAGCLRDPNAGSRNGGSGGGESIADNNTVDGDKKVEILGAFGGAEKASFVKSLQEFQQRTGITIEYVDSSDFTTIIKTRVQGGSEPDIALFPQPGGLLELAAQKEIAPIDTYLDFDAIDRTLVPGFLESARLNGRVYGAPMRMAVKSVVWAPKAYSQDGYPTDVDSIQDLDKVAAEIRGKGIAPWCIGFNADQSTGWVGTDWIEEYMLRMWGPDVYDDWTSHRIPFNDQRVQQAFDEFGKLIKTEGNVFGGADGVINTPFGDAMNPAFQNPPKCLLHRQGNFAYSFYPQEVQADLDNRVDVFKFPRYDGEYSGSPVLGGGDLAGLFNGNDPDAVEVMKFLSSDQFGKEWASDGGWLSPHKTFDPSNYPDDTTRKIAAFASDADVFRFDGSDLMPKAVGSGTFWTGMVEWVRNTKSTKQVTDEIEASWPK
ncbi:ABC transporter substrate-binding protein [Microlunatus sp. GCM10028923]|uniref:ABC transporter substrate-binding protein n=1 Tax=Microlunatus sp. GCM10028923 TaxID=3273400 RepID=UPI00361F5D4C